MSQARIDEAVGPRGCGGLSLQGSQDTRVLIPALPPIQQVALRLSVQTPFASVSPPAKQEVWAEKSPVAHAALCPRLRTRYSEGQEVDGGASRTRTKKCIPAWPLSPGGPWEWETAPRGEGKGSEAVPEAFRHIVLSCFLRWFLWLEPTSTCGAFQLALRLLAHVTDGRTWAGHGRSHDGV